MIEYNLKDYHLRETQALTADVNECRTLRGYRVYGLKPGSNPPILLVGPNLRKLAGVADWLGVQGIEVDLKLASSPRIKIGLRKDVRRDPRVAAALVRTIVGALEQKVALHYFRDFCLPVGPFTRSDHQVDEAEVARAASLEFAPATCILGIPGCGALHLRPLQRALQQEGR